MSDHPHITLARKAIFDLGEILADKDKRIAELAALLDSVPHNHDDTPNSSAMDKDCPRCQWEAIR